MSSMDNILKSLDKYNSLEKKQEDAAMSAAVVAAGSTSVSEDVSATNSISTSVVAATADDITGSADIVDDVSETSSISNTEDVSTAAAVDVTTEESAANVAITPVDISTLAATAVDVRDMQKALKKNKRTRFDESHSKFTVWIDNDLHKILEADKKNGTTISKNVNSALRLWFNLRKQGLIKEEE